MQTGIRLRLFMKSHISMNIIKKTGILVKNYHIRYYNDCYISDILYTSPYYVYYLNIQIFKYSMNA